MAVGVVDAAAVCAHSEISPDAQIPLGDEIAKGGKEYSGAQDDAEAMPASCTATEVVCNDNDEAVAESRVTTALAVALVEAVSACAVVDTSPDAHIPLEAM